MPVSTGAVSKPLVQMQPSLVDPASSVSVLDLSFIVDAIAGTPYLFDGPQSCAP